MTTTATIVFHDAEHETFILHVSPAPTTWSEVWMHVLRKVLDRPDFPLHQVEAELEDWGDDVMDINITSVFPGHLTEIALASDLS